MPLVGQPGEVTGDTGRVKARQTAANDRLLHTAPHAFRGDIEALRGVAVAGVIIYHFYPEGLPGGLTGVDVFFTISGFVISLMLSNWFRAKQFSITRFYAFRFRRLLPASTAVLIGTLVAVWWMLDYATLQRTLADSHWATLFSANYHFYLNAIDYYAPQAPSVFLHFWSLAVEEQFYVVWPLFMWGLVWLEQHLPRKGLVEGLVLATCIASFVLANHMIASNSEKMAAFFLLPSRWWEMAAGFLAFRAHDLLAQHLSAAWRSRMGAAGMAMILWSVVVCSGHGWFPGWGALLPVAGTWIFLVAGAQADANAALASSPLLRRLGQMSYSLYLVHWPVLIISDFRNPSVGTLVGALIAIGVLAWLVSVAVENPLRRHPRGLLVGAVCIGLSLATSSALSLAREPTIVGGEVVESLVLESDASHGGPQPYDVHNDTSRTDAAAGAKVADRSGTGPVEAETSPFRALHSKDQQAWRKFSDFVSASMNRTELPAGLHPSITSEQERRLTMPNHVWSLIHGIGTGFDDPHWIRKEGNGTIVVAGDSYAAQWGFLLLRLAEALDMRLAFHTAPGGGLEKQGPPRAFHAATEQLYHDADVFFTSSFSIKPDQVRDRDGEVSESKVRAKVKEFAVGHMQRVRRWNDNQLWWRMGNPPTACPVAKAVQTKKQAVVGFTQLDEWHDDQYAKSLAEHGIADRTFFTPVMGSLVGIDGHSSAVVGNIVQYVDPHGPSCHLTGTFTNDILGGVFLPWLRLFHQPLLQQLCLRSTVSCEAMGWLD